MRISYFYSQCTKLTSLFFELLDDYLLRTWPDHHYKEENQLENKRYSSRNQSYNTMITIIVVHDSSCTVLHIVV